MDHLAKRITTLVLLLALSVAALAQGDDAEDASAGATEEAATIADALRADPRLETLVALFDETGYLTQLEQPGRLTFFAPSDQAFERLGEETVAELFRNRGALDVIMRSHVAFGASPLNALRQLDALTTLEGTRLRIGDDGESVTVQGVRIDEGTRAGNGVMYVVDRVLLPADATNIKDLLGGPVR